MHQVISKMHFLRLLKDKKIIYLGISQSLFESSMYTFIFIWTPTIEVNFNDITIPYGLIFSIFMIMVMIGSSINNHLSKTTSVSTLITINNYRIKLYYYMYLECHVYLL